MNLRITYQDNYSRKELLLRTFFGFFYIVIPHFFLMYFYMVYVAILQFYAFIMVLINQTYPKVAFDAVVGLHRWNLRINASLYNLVDGFPPFGPGARWEKADLDIAYPTIVTRKRMLFTVFIAPFATIPQAIYIFIRVFAAWFASIYAFFVVLFTKQYPKELHNFMVENERLSMRLNFYLAALYFVYPEFEGGETETDRKHQK